MDLVALAEKTLRAAEAALEVGIKSNDASAVLQAAREIRSAIEMIATLEPIRSAAEQDRDLEEERVFTEAFSLAAELVKRLGYPNLLSAVEDGREAVLARLDALRPQEPVVEPQEPILWEEEPEVAPEPQRASRRPRRAQDERLDWRDAWTSANRGLERGQRPS